MTRPPEAPPDTLADRLADARRRRRAQHRDRARVPRQPLPGMRLREGDRVLHNFSGNDYLGLAERPAAGGAGSGASALVTGYQPVHRDLERALGDFLERDAVLLCGSGYLANLAVTTALAGRGDTIVQDRLCHASLIDAARLSGAALRRFAHANAAAAGERLADAPGLRLLVTDGVFSMDGDAAPLRALAAEAATHGATLVVDDAHGIGVLGERGGGLCDEFGLDAGQVPVLVGTLGKAFGAAGAFVAGSRELVAHLENHARSVIYSTALAPAAAEAALRSLQVIRETPGRRERLRAHVRAFRAGAAARAIPLAPSVTPIQPIVVGAEARALALSSRLASDGFHVTPIRPPTVPEGTSRLRITLSAAHEPAQLEGLLDALQKHLAALETSAPGEAAPAT